MREPTADFPPQVAGFDFGMAVDAAAALCPGFRGNPPEALICVDPPTAPPFADGAVTLSFVQRRLASVAVVADFDAAFRILNLTYGEPIVVDRKVGFIAWPARGGTIMLKVSSGYEPGSIGDVLASTRQSGAGRASLVEVHYQWAKLKSSGY